MIRRVLSVFSLPSVCRKKWNVSYFHDISSDNGNRRVFMETLIVTMINHMLRVIVLLPNKSIRSPGTTPMGLSRLSQYVQRWWVTPLLWRRAGGVRIKTSLEWVTENLDCNVQKNLEAVFAIHPEECVALNKGYLRERIHYSVIKSSTVNEFSQVAQEWLCT